MQPSYMWEALREAGESTYPWLNSNDYTLDEVVTFCSFGAGCPFPGPSHTLGTLEQLPLELLNMVLVQLNIRSLINFRCVNKRARKVVFALPQWQQMLLHAPFSINAALDIRTGGLFSVQKLYNTLCTAECDTCGDYGGFIYLVTCRRVCYLCFTETADYLPLERKDAMRKFGLRRKDLSGLPCMKSIPGRYSSLGPPINFRLTLIDNRAARLAGIAKHGSSTAMQRFVSEMKAKQLEQYHTRKFVQNPEESQNERRRRCEGAPDRGPYNPKRFMAIVRAPFLDPRTESVEDGFYCVGCITHHDRNGLHWRRMFNWASFKSHIREYGEIIGGVHGGPTSERG